MADLPTDMLRYIDPTDTPPSIDAFDPGERAILDHINRRVAAAESLEGILAFLFDEIRKVSACDRLSLAFVEERGDRLVSYITRASYEPVLLKNGYAEDLRGSSLQPILENGALRIINDLEAYLAHHPESRSTKILVREQVRSSMTCPLRVDDRIVGVFFRSARQSHAYEDEHARFHLAMAERLSQAVEKAYRIEQLTAANQAYFEMLGFVTHELKSPVASIMMEAKLLAQGYVGEISATQRDKLEKMIGKGDYLLNLVGEYLDLARLETGEMTPNYRDDVDFISEVLAPSLDIVRSGLDEKGMMFREVVEDAVPPVRLDPDLMKIVLVNLLGNGIKYGREDGELKATVDFDAGRLRVSIWNTGPGFPANLRSKLFRKFSRLDTPELKKKKGTGVGLYTVWRIIQAHGGRIDATSEPGEWAQFSFEIPVGEPH